MAAADRYPVPVKFVCFALLSNTHMSLFKAEMTIAAGMRNTG